MKSKNVKGLLEFMKQMVELAPTKPSNFIIDEETLQLLKKTHPDIVQGDGSVAVGGIPVRAMSPREAAITCGCIYSRIRWHQDVTSDLVDLLLKAVPDDELMELVLPIMDQYFDDNDAKDPLDSMTHAEVNEMRRKLEEVGIEAEI